MDHNQEFLFIHTIVTLSSTELTTQKGNWASFLQQASKGSGESQLHNIKGSLTICKPYKGRFLLQQIRHRPYQISLTLHKPVKIVSQPYKAHSGLFGINLNFLRANNKSQVLKLRLVECTPGVKVMQTLQHKPQMLSLL